MSPPSTPLRRPDRYFSERTASLGRGVAVAGLTILVLLAGVYALGWMFAANIDGTVTVDNPAYPGDTFCDGDSPGRFTPSGCDEPEQVERNIDHFIWKAIGTVAGQLAIGLPIVWVLVAGTLHAGSWLANGEGPFGRTLTVAAWGMVPALLGMVVTLLAFWVTFDPITVSSGQDPAAFRDQAIAQLDAMRLVGQASGVLTMAWGAVIWRFGLLHERGVSGTAASAVAAVAAVLFLLLGVA
ncbi:Yip1 family protein [Haloglomus halophilum]|uniref:Yip1 family protein n=1 Tax=Haloglomus halophilum TaxID=2962672 RepID=UPI0020C95A97|nr:Yip1 family protein [Haloglomus halophilum]